MVAASIETTKHGGIVAIAVNPDQFRNLASSLEVAVTMGFLDSVCPLVRADYKPGDGKGQLIQLVYRRTSKAFDRLRDWPQGAEFVATALSAADFDGTSSSASISSFPAAAAAAASASSSPISSFAATTATATASSFLSSASSVSSFPSSHVAAAAAASASPPAAGL
jgi:hypothetical protein